jgi:hypothetical protein
MLASTLLMSAAPKPVAVRLCLGRLKPGPTGPTNVEVGAPIESFRSLGARSTAAAAIVRDSNYDSQRAVRIGAIDQEVRVMGKLGNVRRSFVECDSAGGELKLRTVFASFNPAFSGAYRAWEGEVHW